jgi:hypothetical protein
MKRFAILLISVITIAALVQPAAARDTWDTERTKEIIKDWGSEHDAALVPAAAPGTWDTQPTVRIIRN